MTPSPTALATPQHSCAAPAPSSAGGAGFLMAGGMLLGTLGVFVQEAGQDPLRTVWFRCAFGALALLAYGALSGRLPQLRLAPRAWALAGASALLMLLNWALFFAAIPRISLGLATVVFHIQPLWALLLGVLLLGERLRPAQLAGALAALLGLAMATLLASAAGPLRFGERDFVWGLLLCLGGSLSYAGVAILARRAQHRVSAYAMATWQCLIGSAVLLPAPLWLGWPPLGTAWLWLAGLGVLHTGLAYVLLFAGMARLPVAQSARLQFVYPVVALAVDWLVYGHALGGWQMLGVGVMGAGLWAMWERPA